MQTDSNGGFVFRDLPNGTYWVVVEREGYKPARQSVVLDLHVEPKVQVDIVLERVNSTGKRQLSLVEGSPSSYRFNAKVPMREFSLKARREYEKGNRKQQAQNFPSAISHYQKALKIEPGFYPALNNLGAVFLRQRDFRRAEECFQRALRLNAQDGEAYINLGHAYYEEGKYELAIRSLSEGVERDPQSALGRFFLGSSYFKQGDCERAEAQLKKACALDPARMASAHLQLANLYLRRRDVAAAKLELESFLRINPESPQAPAIKKTLANLKER